MRIISVPYHEWSASPSHDDDGDDEAERKVESTLWSDRVDTENLPWPVRTDRGSRSRHDQTEKKTGKGRLTAIERTRQQNQREKLAQAQKND